MGNLERQKIVERDDFTYEERTEIAKKSDDRCCHCGKKIYFGYGATVEHFVPLSKGGTNRDINMIMLCEKCNKQKGNYIISPEDYVPYLHKEDFDKLSDYFESYIKSFDFINRKNVLACDLYKIYVIPYLPYLEQKKIDFHKNKKANNLLSRCENPYIIKRATKDDLSKILNYYIKYLRKYGCLESEAEAAKNIAFWMRFGCIYYIGNGEGGVKCFITLDVTNGNGYQKAFDETGKEVAIRRYLTINVFSYYSNDYNATLISALMRQVPIFIMKEQNLRQLPLRFCIVKGDSLAYIADGKHVYGNHSCLMDTYKILWDGKENLPPIENDENLGAFFNRFNTVTKEDMVEWFKGHGGEPADWMMSEIISDKSSKADN